MNVKDTVAGVFMFLTVASWIAIASLMTDVRGSMNGIDDNTYCIAHPRDNFCNDSSNISAPNMADSLLTVN